MCEILNIQSEKKELWSQVNNFSILILAAVWHRAWPTFPVPVDQERQSASRVSFCHRLNRDLLAYTWLAFKNLIQASKLTQVNRSQVNAVNKIKPVISVKLNKKKEFL